MARPADGIALSILVLTLPERHRPFRRLVGKLDAQARGRSDVEVLALLDNQALTISEKRNALLAMARGTHLAFVDDDDDVADDYVARITAAIAADPAVDVVCFHQVFRLNGKPGRVLSAMEHPTEPPLRSLGIWRFADLRRKPYHWCAWRSALAKSEAFREARRPRSGQSYEDLDWLLRLYPKVTRSVVVDACLHVYEYDDRLTRSRLVQAPARALRDRLVAAVRRRLPTGWLRRLPRT
jgi:hypothetical protein